MLKVPLQLQPAQSGGPCGAEGCPCCDGISAGPQDSGVQVPAGVSA